MRNSFIHPGEILEEEFLKPLEISQYKLANDISVPRRRINEIVHGDRAVTADTALRFAEYFGTSPEFWLNLQSRYDLLVEAKSSGAKIKQQVTKLEMVAA
jgi:addiction module HigA family antidote